MVRKTLTAPGALPPGMLPSRDMPGTHHAKGSHVASTATKLFGQGDPLCVKCAKAVYIKDRLELVCV